MPQPTEWSCSAAAEEARICSVMGAASVRTASRPCAGGHDRGHVPGVTWSDQPQVPGAQGRLGPVPRAELGQDVGDVVLDGAFGEEEPGGDLPVAATLG